MTNIQISVVKSGFVLSIGGSNIEPTTEVFTSQGKLMKAVRTYVEEHSLVGKSKDSADAAVE